MLVGLFVVVALITYACTRSSSSDDGGGQATGTTTPSPTPEASSTPSVSPPASPSASPNPSASAGQDAAGGSGQGGGSQGGGSGDTGDSGDESGGGSEDGSGGGAGGSDGIAAPKSPDDPCRPSDVVVTLKANKSDYDWNDKPKFEVTLVNTEDQTCTVDVGPKRLEIRITSGDDRIFSTADCVEGRAVDKQKLERGVPFTKKVTWDRMRSWEDCRDRRVKAKRPGTYVARLHSDYDQGAEPQVFRLN
ncbi:hypothetical protein [Streptomonospora litoralis]|uniref:Uncharacterized protein n=1 Tax=Streptomonospora litoralis TaxID=2498135 RepID=A0A4V0ZK81_9ACTN|nr:hypothetical protein [Streptomonospora litoralis]QBI56062.1 hypothetical protein EKD16_21535 [Streptomonospora litoralis]